MSSYNFDSTEIVRIARDYCTKHACDGVMSKHPYNGMCAITRIGDPLPSQYIAQGFYRFDRTTRTIRYDPLC